MPADDVPVISVVTTAYQAEAFTARCLASAAAMTGPWPIEILLFDDGSTDATAAVAEAMAATDVRIKAIRGGRCGRAAALNRAIEQSNGRYIAILDADDIALPHRLEATVPVLEADPKLAMVVADARLFDDEIPDVPMRPRGAPGLSRITPGMLYASNRIVHSTVLFRRDAWKAAGGYDETLDICVDYSFYFRLLRIGGIAHVGEIVCLRQKRADSYFARKPSQAYAEALTRIRAEARAGLPIPLSAQFGATMRSLKGVARDLMLRPGGTAGAA